jgi:hypothetical protein
MSTKYIRGVDSTMKTLRKINPTLEKESKKRIKSDIKPMVSAARALVPKQAPLSGWRTSGSPGSGTERSGESRFPAWSNSANRRINSSIRRGKKQGYKGRILLVSMRQTDAAGAVFDIAGKRNAGNRLDRSLRKAGWGTPSRSMWKAAEKHLPTVQKSVQASIRDTEQILNRELRLG